MSLDSERVLSDAANDLLNIIDILHKSGFGNVYKTEQISLYIDRLYKIRKVQLVEAKLTKLELTKEKEDV